MKGWWKKDVAALPASRCTRTAREGRKTCLQGSLSWTTTGWPGGYTHCLAALPHRRSRGSWEAEDGAQAVEMAHRLRPDVVTMDVGLLDANELEVTRRLRADMPGLNVVVVTVDYGYEEEAFDAGALR